MDKHKSWTLQAKELLSRVQHQKFDVVFVSLPAKGMTRLSMGVMTNFRAHFNELKECWPQISNTDRSNSGARSNRCKCGFSHSTLETTRAQNFAVEAAVCAHFLEVSPQLNEVRLRGNGEFHFSPLADADSSGNFLFRQQPWLQARWRAWQDSAGLKVNKTKVEREKKRKCGGKEDTVARMVEVRRDEGEAISVNLVERSEETGGQDRRSWKRKAEGASPELVSAEEARGGGSALTAQLR